MNTLSIVLIIFLIYYVFVRPYYHNGKKRKNSRHEGFRSPYDFLNLPDPISSYNQYPEPLRHYRPDYSTVETAYVINNRDSNIPLAFAYNSPVQSSYTPEGFQPKPEKITKNIINNFMDGLNISQNELQYLPTPLNPLYLPLNNLSGNRGWLNG